MSDELPSDQHMPEQEGDSSLENASEDDIDALLESASSLAAELTDGPSELPATAITGTDDLLAGSDSPAKIDEKLDEVQELLETAESELATQEDTIDDKARTDLEEIEAALDELGSDLQGDIDTEKEPPPAPKPATTPLAETDDLTKPPPSPEAVAGTDDLTGATVAPPPPDHTNVMDFSSFDDQMGDLTSIPSLDEPDEDDLGGANSEDGDSSTEDEDEEALEGPTGTIAAIAFKLSNHLATALEVADKPFSRIPASIRVYIGYVAVATCATAMIVLLISLL